MRSIRPATERTGTEAVAPRARGFHRQLLVILWLLAWAAQPVAAQSQPSATVQQSLLSLIQGQSADVGVAALDLQSGKLVTVNGDRDFPMASTVKVAVAAAYLSQVDHGRRSLDDKINGKSAATLIELMLTRSSNPATDLLIRDLGGPRAIQEWLNWYGHSEIKVDRYIAQLLSDRRDLWDKRDSATPKALAALLRNIDESTWLKPQSRAYLLDVMSRCITGRNRIRGLLPRGTPVAHKTGTLAGLSNDMGILTLPDGRRIALVIFVRGGADRSRTIAEAARTIYDGFFKNTVASNSR